MKNYLSKISMTFITGLLISSGLNAQQTVDAGALNKSYAGGFFRTDIGVALGQISYGDFEGRSIGTLHFHFEPGMRFNKKVAAYAFLSGDVPVEDDSQITTFTFASIGVGSHLFLSSPNLYISPEVGVAILEMNEGFGLGASFTIKSGVDLPLGKNRFFGLNAFYTLFSGSDKDTSNKMSGKLMGAAVSLKIGK